MDNSPRLWTPSYRLPQQVHVRIVAPDWIVRSALARLVERMVPDVVLTLADVIDPDGSAFAPGGFSSQPTVLILNIRDDTRETASHLFTGPVVLLVDDGVEAHDTGDALVVRQWRKEPALVRAALDTVLARFKEMAQPGAVGGRIAGLTRRQADVLERVAQGLSNADIGLDLGMSENTVRIHVSAILRTLGLSNRTQAALWATGQTASPAVRAA